MYDFDNGGMIVVIVMFSDRKLYGNISYGDKIDVERKMWV